LRRRTKEGTHRFAFGSGKILPDCNSAMSEPKVRRREVQEGG
jgi:hypothetical protein